MAVPSPLVNLEAFSRPNSPRGIPGWVSGSEGVRSVPAASQQGWAA